MGDKDNSGTGTETETDQEQANRFNGFSVIDGEVQEPPKDEKAEKAAKGSKAADGDDTAKAGEGDDTTKAGEGDDKHRSAQDRINKAVRSQRAAERRADAAEQRANSLEQRFANLEARLTTPKGGGNAGDADKEPDPKSYQGGEFDTRYIRDLARYEARQATKETSAQSREAASTQQAREAAAESQRVIDEFTEKASDTYPDFAEVVFDESNKFSTTLVLLSLDSEHGAQIAYELANDPKEQRRLAALTPAAQTKWFVKRELELEGSSPGSDADGEDAEAKAAAALEAKRTKAPPPPAHKGKGTGGTGQVSAATTDFAAFERMATGGGRN